MKVQFTPLSLYFFVVVLGLSTMVSAFGKTDLNTSRKTSNNPLPNYLTEAVNDNEQRNDIDNRVVTTEVDYSTFKKDLAIHSAAAYTPALVSSSTVFMDATGIFGIGMFYGVLSMILLLNAICYFIFNSKPFLYFAGAILMMGAALFVTDGLSIGLNTSIATQTLFAETTLMVVFLAAWSAFSHNYLKIDQAFPKMNWAVIALLSVAAVMSTIAWGVSNEWMARAGIVVGFMIPLAYLAAGIALFSKKNYAKFYVISSAIPTLFAIDFFVLQPLGAGLLFTEMFHVKMAAIIEMLLLTYAITYRMQELKEESELRQVEMRIYLKRQQMMNRENISKMMEDVYLENLIMKHDLDGFEIKLLQYISEGKENAKIARKLKVTEDELEERTQELYHKLEIGEQIKEDHRMVEAQPDYIYN